MNRYLVWEESESREDARKIEAHSRWDAAKKWAERDDYESAEFSIVKGNMVVVRVEDAETGEVTRFEITGAAIPIYYATEVPNATPSK